MLVKQKVNNFADLVSGSQLPILAAFSADWCEPCQRMAPILEQLQAQMQQQLQVVKINADDYPVLATQYHVHSLPTLILFKQGRPVAHFVEIMSVEALIYRLRALI